jgi:hypothetical protein
MKMISPLLTLCALWGAHAAAADDCRRSPEGLIAVLAGEHTTGQVNFKYESRVQKDSLAANRYTWCIENTHTDHVSQFIWGDSGRYFSGIVEPLKMSPSIRPDSSTQLADGRQLQFRRLNGRWSAITVETIFPQRLASVGRLRVAQVLPGQGSETIDRGLVDLTSLSKEALDKFVQERGKIEFASHAVATVPVTAEAQKSVEIGEYSTYNSRDFARLSVHLFNIVYQVGSRTETRLSVLIRPTSKDDEQRLASGDNTKALRFNIASNIKDPAIPGVMSWVLGIDSNETLKELIVAPVDRLGYAEVTVRVSALGLKRLYAVIPVRVLVPVARI